jgi:hypothetical protein
MGTMIQLSLGGFQIDLGKNDYFQNHSALFQKIDLKTVPDYGYDEPIYMEGYTKTLRHTLGRLELLGYSLESVKREYALNLDEWGEPFKRKISFKKICDLVKNINVGEVTGKWKWSKNPENKFVPSEILPKIEPIFDPYDNYRPDYWDIEFLLEGLTPYAKLRLLAENSKNLDVPIIWPFGLLVDNGWAKKEQFFGSLDHQKKFLIVTEGSSDSKILQKALTILKPEYADFFRFIDMEEGYPFSGTGNLYRFCQGLVSIGILNRVVVLYDNDAEGVSKFEATRKLSLPKNMIAAKLPELQILKKFDTIGPNGERKENINGKAASIECYLDLSYPEKKSKPRIRWSSYIDSINEYQGALEDKTVYMKYFLDQRVKEINYDYSKLNTLLQYLYDICVKMAILDFTPTKIISIESRF